MPNITPCRRIFGQQRGAAVHEFVERSTGRPCPCLSQGQCPLVDAFGHSPLLPDDDEPADSGGRQL